MHGGASPQVKRAARERLALLIDPSFDALMRALRGRDLGAAVRAATNSLDRAGIKPDVMSRERVLELFDALGRSVFRHVTDENARKAIFRDMADAMGQPITSPTA